MTKAKRACKILNKDRLTKEAQDAKVLNKVYNSIKIMQDMVNKLKR